MPTYTVICAEKSTGAIHPLLIAGVSEEEATAKAAAAGFLVNKTLLAIDDRDTARAAAELNALAAASAHANADTARQLTALNATSIIASPTSTIAAAVMLGMLMWAILAAALVFALAVLGLSTVATR